MKSLHQLHKNFLSADKRYDKKKDELRKQRDEIEKKMNAMEYPHFLTYLEKLGKAVLPLLPTAVSFETLGPFGMSCECAIHFHGAKNKQGVAKIVASATFARFGDGFGIKDYTKKTNRFPKGSLGDLNGGNYKTIPITEEMTIEWFAKFVCKQKN